MIGGGCSGGGGVEESLFSAGHIRCVRWRKSGTEGVAAVRSPSPSLSYPICAAVDVATQPDLVLLLMAITAAVEEAEARQIGKATTTRAISLFLNGWVTRSKHMGDIEAYTGDFD